MCLIVPRTEKQTQFLKLFAVHMPVSCWKNRQESGIDTQDLFGTTIYIAHVYNHMATKPMNMHGSKLI